MVGQPESVSSVRRPFGDFFCCCLAASNFPIPVGVNLLLLMSGEHDRSKMNSFPNLSHAVNRVPKISDLQAEVRKGFRNPSEC
jgi:hypothetical protein